jgi:DNA-binding FrmR family transcriptional regulator
MKIKDPLKKKRVGDRLRRIEWQVRWVIQMIEDEANVRDIVQQLSAIKSALVQSMNEEVMCTLEKMMEKQWGPLDEKDLAEIRDLMKIIR